MKKLFESPGNLYFVEDIHGKPVSEAMANFSSRVHAVVNYELKPHPQSPLAGLDFVGSDTQLIDP